MTTTRYTLHVNGQPTDFARSTKATVIAEAERVRNHDRVDVAVVTQAGTEVFSLAAPKQRVVTKHTKPFTKTITVDEQLAALVLEGYEPAYRRPRNGATVLRNMEAELDERYAVVYDDESQPEFAPTTREAGQLMKAHAVA